MGLIADLHTRLTTYPGLTELVGNKVWPVQARQGAVMPYCVFFQVSGGRKYSHSGYSNLQRPRIQVSCYARTYDGAKEVAAQVTAALESWSSVNAKVCGVFQQNEVDLSEEDWYHVPVDFFIWYKG